MYRQFLNQNREKKQQQNIDDYSDHMALLLDIEKSNTKTSKKQKLTIRNYSEKNMETFKQLLILDPIKVDHSFKNAY